METTWKRWKQSLCLFFRVNATLMTGTAVNVSADAIITSTELPYEATLTAVFPDGKVKKHQIAGTYQETVLTNVRVTKVQKKG